MMWTIKWPAEIANLQAENEELRRELAAKDALILRIHAILEAACAESQQSPESRS